MNNWKNKQTEFDQTDESMERGKNGLMNGQMDGCISLIKIGMKDRWMNRCIRRTDFHLIEMSD